MNLTNDDYISIDLKEIRKSMKNIDLENIFIQDYPEYIEINVSKLLGGGLFSKCKQYPLVEDITEASDILNALFPARILGSDGYHIFLKFLDVVKLFNPSSDLGKLLETAIQAVVATSAAVFTMGLGGDRIVNAVFTIKKGIFFSIDIIQFIDYVLGTLTIQTNIQNEQPEFTENMQKIQNIQLDPDAIRFIADLFNINFNDGPSGVKCWVDQIYKKYNMEGTNIFLCQALMPLYFPLVEFIANFIGTSIPNVGIIVIEKMKKMMKTNFGKKLGMKLVIRHLKKSYRKIPKKFRKMIEDPDKFKDYIDTELNYYRESLRKAFGIDEEMIYENEMEGGMIGPPGYKFAKKFIEKRTGDIMRITGINKIFIPQIRNVDKLINLILMHSEFFPYVLNKLLAISFAILYVFKKCPIQ
jgi:hypothetical protein